MTAEAPEPIPGLAIAIYNDLHADLKAAQELGPFLLHVDNVMRKQFPMLAVNKIEKIRFWQDNHGRLCVEDASNSFSHRV